MKNGDLMEIAIAKKSQREGFDFFILNNNEEAKYHYILKLKNEKPWRFQKDSDFKRPKNAIKLLRKADKVMIEHNNNLESMLNKYQINFVEKNFCRFCRIEDQITLLRKNQGYDWHGDAICKECALDQLKKEAHYRYNEGISMDHARKLLGRFKDLEKIIKMFDPDFDPTEHPEITKFDELSKKKTEVEDLHLQEINIPEELTKVYEEEGIENLLPVQTLSVKNSLLDDENLLIAAATASGKTLVGEMAGISNILRNGEKFLFMVPLVALANQKYEEFKDKYEPLGLDVSLRVGLSRLEERKMERSLQADIIVGTYEGFDFLLRSGRQIRNVGTIAIDEIHMLNEEGRGPRLDGLISRLRCTYPDSQFLGLSATVGNTEELGGDLGMKPVVYEDRPVPIERHILLTKNKRKNIRKLVRNEAQKTTGKGYKGQTIVFTNSRRKCHNISESLGPRAAAYHSGLSYNERKSTEDQFKDQEIDSIVTTAALGAGVDFPASQVIFESLVMGIKWLTINEFNQMLGRAGRPKYHMKGKVFLLVDPEFERGDRSEEEVAFDLLKGDIEPVGKVWTKEEEEAQILADIVSNSNLDKAYKFSLGSVRELNDVLTKLEDRDMIQKNKRWISTDFGEATSISFLKPNESEFIRKNLNSNPLETCIKLQSLENVYIEPKIRKKIESSLGFNIPSNVFSNSIPHMIEELKEQDLMEDLVDMMFELSLDNPEEAKVEVGNRVAEYRKLGYGPSKIARMMSNEYHLKVYTGDIYSWLDNIIRHLEAFIRIAKVFDNSKAQNKAEKEINNLERD